MTPIVEVEGLTKTYDGRPAVDDLSLQVHPGDLYGFVGPNGAGKTSTIRIMATLLEPDRGQIHIAGHSIEDDPRAVRRNIGYMPDFFGVYNDMKVWEYLDFFGACFDLPRAARGPLIEDLLELVELGHRRDDAVQALSRGMKQRLSLARTLIHDPQVLLLDEPASGLDPRARVEIRELLVALAEMGKTVFFSTHILADVAEICNQVGIIEAGRLVAQGPLEELSQAILPHRRIRLQVLTPPQEAAALLESRAEVSTIRLPDRGKGGPRVRVEFFFSGDDTALSDLLSDLVDGGVQVVHLSEEARDLEDVFLQVTKGLVT